MRKSVNNISKDPSIKTKNNEIINPSPIQPPVSRHLCNLVNIKQGDLLFQV